MTIEHALAQWAVDVSVQRGENLRALARDALFDITACIVAGSVDSSTRTILKSVVHFGRGPSLAMGSKLRLASPWAALVSGTAAHALDFDDNLAPATTHATAVLAPALFALADERGSSGAEVIDAYIVGLELQARIGQLVNPEHYERGWHGTSTVGAIGTAGACARLLRLDALQTRAAMSIAFSMAAGSKKQFGTLMKPVHAGLAAKNAVLAAQMAEAGIDGDAVFLTDRWGFADLYGGTNDEDRVTRMRRELGAHWLIELEGLMAKRFPCCAAAHRTLDGLVELRRQYGFELEEVERIEAFIPAFARANLRFDEPSTEAEARFSLTYCAVRVVDSGRLSLRDMTLERVRDSKIRPWLGRVVIREKPGSVSEELSRNATPARTQVLLKNGNVHEIGISAPKGSLQRPLSEDEKLEKFRDCCQWAGKAQHVDPLCSIARTIHEQPSMAEFSQALARYF